MKRILFVLLLIFSGCSTAQSNGNPKIYIRVNQVGFNTDDVKSAIVLSNINLTGRRFYLVDKVNVKVFSDFIRNSKGKYASFPYSYEIDFSDFKNKGRFALLIADSKSPQFEISDNVYSGFASYLLKFFEVQRCGPTHPYLHKKCHISDVTSIIENGKERHEIFDVTGGWHDAGDYTKFLNTIAFSTYLLLFSYDFAPEKFSFDLNKNQVPDILEEAKIGLDWLLRANYKNRKLVTQVQNEKDQKVGWRLPENDPLQFDRPGFIGIGKNLIGIYVAALALGSKIWENKIHYSEFAEKLKNTAIGFYELINESDDLDTTGTGFYRDTKFNGKLSLGAIELYELTGNEKYLQDSENFARKAGTEAWWGWGNVANIADYKIAKYDKAFIEFLQKSLIKFKKHSESKVFGEGVDLYWGSNMNLLGVALTNILYKKFTNDNTFDKIEFINRDYILGRNPWGISFIYGKGANYTKHFHHQVAYFNKGKLPGGLTGGPVMKKIYGDLNINYETKDKFSAFQTDDAYYRDDRNDYVCNEPTISANATAVFVFGNLR